MIETRLLRAAQLLVFLLIVRPFVQVFMGLRVAGAPFLPKKGPAVIIANHNSHLDTLTLMAQMPLAELWNVRPVAAADHFKTGTVGFLARNMLRSILIPRDRGAGMAALDPVLAALDRGEILIFFPEGSRGEAEVMSRFKRGISHIVGQRPNVPVVPAYLHNMGRCMPKGATVFVPFNCEIIVGTAADFTNISVEAVPQHLQSLVETLSKQTSLCTWDRELGHGLGDARLPSGLA